MTYEWRVRVSSATAPIGEDDTSWSPWSQRRSFHTPVRTAQGLLPVFPTDGAAGVEQPIQLRWYNSDTDVFYYEVQVSTDPGFGEQSAVAPVWHNLVHGGLTRPVNQWLAPDLVSGTTHYWRVRPRVQGDGRPVAWGPAWRFETR